LNFTHAIPSLTSNATVPASLASTASAFVAIGIPQNKLPKLWALTASGW
jgi:hypothetical protein